MTAKKPAGDPFLAKLKKEITDMLEGDTLTPAERLKAIEAGAKILGIQHKIDGESERDGSFFAAK